MEVILLQRIENLGSLGDQVKVKPGYARNYLIPQGKATEATADNISRFEARRAELETAAAGRLAAAQSRARELIDMVITIPALASNEGRLYGSVGPAEIADAVTSSGVQIEKREVLLDDGAFREVGEFDVTIRLYSGVDTPIRVNVVAE